MRFKEFITEEISLSKYQKNIDIMINRKLILFRSMVVGGKAISLKTENGEVKAYEYDGRQSPRRSKTGSDVMMIVASAWEDFPNRTLSTFTSQSHKHATEFSGQAGIVVPADSVSLYGYSPSDFNESEAKTKLAKYKDDIDGVIVKITKLVNWVEFYLRNEKDSNPFKDAILSALEDNGIKDEVKKLRNQIIGVGDKLFKIGDFIDWMLKRERQLKYMVSDLPSSSYAEDLMFELGVLKKVLAAPSINVSTVKDFFAKISPENFKAKSFTTLSKIPVKSTASEVWFEGNYLFIEVSNSDWFTTELAVDLLKGLK